MSIFGNQGRQQPQMSQQQMQAIAQQQLEDFGNNMGSYIDRSGMNIPQEMRGNVPAMCRHLIQSGQVPQERLRIAQPLIDRLLGRR